MTIDIEDFGVRYPGQKQQAIHDVSLTAGAGELLGVAGRTGAGKSTLCLGGGGFIPRVVRASVEGRVRIDDVEVTKATLAETAGLVGIVFATPSLQLSASKTSVREEVAFGLENLAVPREEMGSRIDQVMDQLGIGHLADREPLALSGGEQQRVAIASILVMGTGALVLDEPTAQLDPAGTSDIAKLLSDLARDGRAVLVAEHAPEVLAQATRCAVIDGGRIVTTDVPGAALAPAVLGPLGLDSPTVVSLAVAVDVDSSMAFDESAVAAALRSRAPSAVPDHPSVDRIEIAQVRASAPVPIRLRDLRFRYGEIEALRGVSISVEPGERVAIVGQNGSGKTTLIKQLNGLLRPESGSVLIGEQAIGSRLVSDIAREVGFVFQNPDDQLFNGSVEREVAFGPRNLGMSALDVGRLVDVSLEMVGLSGERQTNPYDLGFSHRKLVALASVLAMEPPVLVMDEPTTGQDGPGINRIGSIVEAWAGVGRTVIAISHDMEFAARHFTRIVVMRHGEIVLDGEPDLVFAAQNDGVLASTGLTAPPAARIARTLGLSLVPADAAALLNLLADPN